MSFPKFEEYKQGTILEVEFDNFQPTDTFLIMILGYKFINAGEVAIYLNGDHAGTSIHINHAFKIKYQKVKRGGLK